jgi:hypothetical protein
LDVGSGFKNTENPKTVFYRLPKIQLKHTEVFVAQHSC